MRSIVVPHKVSGGCDEMIEAMCCKDGKEKVGFGLGDKVLAPLRSAMKLTFSDDFGLTNALRLLRVEWLGFSGIRNRKPSLCRVCNIMVVTAFDGRMVNGSLGM